MSENISLSELVAAVAEATKQQQPEKPEGWFTPKEYAEEAKLSECRARQLLMIACEKGSVEWMWFNRGRNKCRLFRKK